MVLICNSNNLNSIPNIEFINFSCNSRIVFNEMMKSPTESGESGGPWGRWVGILRSLKNREAVRRTTGREYSLRKIKIRGIKAR